MANRFIVTRFAIGVATLMTILAVVVNIVMTVGRKLASRVPAALESRR